jgi:hypothetical protein
VTLGIFSKTGFGCPLNFWTDWKYYHRIREKMLIRGAPTDKERGKISIRARFMID